MKQADPSHSSTKFDAKITRKQFFDLCTSRQLSVRRLLEAFGSSTVSTDGIKRVSEHLFVYMFLYVNYSALVCMYVLICVCVCVQTLSNTYPHSNNYLTITDSLRKQRFK